MNQREIACNIILQFERKKQRLDEIESDYLKKSDMSTDEMRHIKNLTSGSLRHRSVLDWYCSQLYKGNFSRLLPELKVLIRLGLYEINYMEHIPVHASVHEYVELTKQMVNERSAKLVNAIFRSFIRQKTDLGKKLKTVENENPALFYSFQEWMIKGWIKLWGKSFTKKLCQAFNQLPEFSIRVNQKKITVDSFRNALDEKKIIYTESEKIKGYFKIKQIGHIREAGFFDKGLCSVQDESAAIPVKLLNLVKGDTFIDVCAAPGGKFTQALEESSGLSMAIAVDKDLSRLKKVSLNLFRLDLQGYVVAADVLQMPFKIKFRKMLIDAPCSGQGVIGKHPDIKWRRTDKEVNEFSELQKKILQHTLPFLDNGGQLVYSTCSIDRRENEDVIDSLDKKFLVADPSFKVIKSDNSMIKTLPSTDNMDGSFACVIMTSKKST